MADETQRWRSRLLVLAALLLGLPCVVFVLTHVVRERLQMQLPERLDVALAWIMVFTGMFGAFTTVGALVVAIIGCFVTAVPGYAKVLMCSFAVASLLALAYLAQVSP